jgi:hypothetical protein
MDLFENSEQIKDRVLRSLENIMEDKKIIYGQIKQLETENYVLDNNLEYFDAYLNYLNHVKYSNENVSINKNIEDNFKLKENNIISFEDYLSIKYKRNQDNYINNNNNYNYNYNENDNDKDNDKDNVSYENNK